MPQECGLFLRSERKLQHSDKKKIFNNEFESNDVEVNEQVNDLAN
jgi:hypothetical protein